MLSVDSNGMLTGEHMLLDSGIWCDMYFEWDSHGRLIKETNPNGNKTRYRYDTLFSEPSSKIPPEQYESGLETRYEYDCLDHLIRVTTPEGSVYAYRKGSDDRLLKAVNPNAYSRDTDDGEGMTFDYDATGRLHLPVRPVQQGHSTRRNEDGDQILQQRRGHPQAQSLLVY